MHFQNYSHGDVDFMRTAVGFPRMLIPRKKTKAGSQLISCVWKYAETDTGHWTPDEFGKRTRTMKIEKPTYGKNNIGLTFFQFWIS